MRHSGRDTEAHDSVTSNPAIHARYEAGARKGPGSHLGTVAPDAMSSWDRSGLRAAIVLVVTLKVAGLVLVVDWTGRTTNPFDLAKSLYSRSLEWVLVALLVVAFLQWGSAVLPRTRLHLFI